MRPIRWLPWLLLAGCGRSGLLQSDVSVTPTALQFGDVQLHATGGQSVTVVNAGLTPDEVTVQGTGDGPFAWSQMTFSLGTHASVNIPVFFSPTELGVANGVLHVKWSTGGQDVALSGSGTPFPCQAGSPDGTPCQLWWAPCAVGAACRGGVCHSATAEAEQPGDLRWTFPVREAVPLVADPEGDTFSLLGARLGILALDACGQSLWQSQIGYDFLLLGGDTLVASSAGGQVAGFSRRDGTQLWSADVGQVLGCAGSGAPCASLRVSEPLLTNDGILYLFATSTGSAGGETVSRVAFGLDGSLLTTVTLASEPRGFAMGSVVGDVAGNSYFSSYVDGTLSDIQSYDPQGAFRFRLKELSDPLRLAVNQTSVIGAGIAWALDGTTTEEIPSPAGLGAGWCGDIGASDATGTLYCFTSLASPDAVMAVSSSASVLWSSNLQAGYQADSNLVLGDSALFVLAGQPGSGPDQLVAMVPADGGVAWTVTPFPKTSPGPMSVPKSLTLSPTATLVTSDSTAIYGVFAGQVRTATGAFWSRFGGDETNRSVPGPSAGN